MKISSIRLKLFVVLSIILSTAQTALAQSGSWSDYKASAYESGSGKQTDPYIIKTAEQLAYFASQVSTGNDMGAYFELGADINLADHWWKPIGNTGGNNPGQSFTGSFDGKGFTISNMNRDWGAEENSGLFSFIKGSASVKNIVFKNAYLTNQTGNLGGSSARRVGVLAGGMRGTPTIENIKVYGSKIDLQTKVTQNNAWVLIGGLVGGIYDNPTFKNCYVDVDVDLRNITNYTSKGLDQAWFSMFLGAAETNSQPTIEDVFVAGKLQVAAGFSYKYLGTLVGSNSAKDKNGVFKGNNYYVNAPTSNGTSNPSYQSQGTQKVTIKEEAYVHNEKTISYTATVAGSGETVSGITWTVDGETVTPVDGSDGYKITVPLKNKIREGVFSVTINGMTINKTFTLNPRYYSVDLYADSYAGGSGTKDDPYLISNDMQLAKLAYDVFHGSGPSNRVMFGKYFKLTADIDLSTAAWMPIGSWHTNHARWFAGKFDGCGHTIKNMQIYYKLNGDEWGEWGLFSRIEGNANTEEGLCCVTNFIIDNARVEKEAGVKLSGRGTNIGVVASEMYPNTEFSNIIIKNSIITDNEETYDAPSKHRIGGFIGNINDPGFYRIFNLSTDAKIQVLKNAKISNQDVYLSTGFGSAKINRNNNANYIYPTNIYMHGENVDSKFNTYYVATAFAHLQPATDNSQLSTVYYAKALPEANKNYNNGNKKEYPAFAKTFVQQNNLFIDNKGLDDKCVWVYTPKNGFSFGSTTITINRGDTDVLTAETVKGNAANEKYYWYVSTDRKNWTKQSETASNPFTLPRQEYDQYVYAELEDGTSCSRYELVNALRVSAALRTDSIKGAYVVKITNTVWNNNDNLKITYDWVKNDAHVGTDAVYDTGKVTETDKISCHVIVKDKNGNVLLDKWVYRRTIVYLKPTGDTTLETEKIADASWGFSPTTPMSTWRGAYSKLSPKGTWDDNIIVLLGTSSQALTKDDKTGFNLTINYKDNSNNVKLPEWDEATKDSILLRSATITGKWEDDGYNYNNEGVIEFDGDNYGLPIWGDTRFQDITFRYGNQGGSRYGIIYAQFNNLEMGKGLIMEKFPNTLNEQGLNYGTIDGANTVSLQIFGGLKSDGRFAPLNDPVNIKKMETYMPHGRDGFKMTFKSGFYSCICVGGRQVGNQGLRNGVMGTPNMPIKCTIDFDIDRDFNDKHNNNDADYDAGVILAGNHEGAMYTDVDIIIRSGNVARVVNGTLGNQTRTSFWYRGKEYVCPYNSVMGRSNITLDPGSSTYAIDGEKEEQRNNRVIVTELYGGGAGRGFQNNITVINPFYGESTVTINGGTFKILSQDKSKIDKIVSGIYGAGAGGYNGIGEDGEGKHTPDGQIPFWNDTKDVMLYGTYEDAKKNNLIKYHCYNADTHTYKDIDPTETNTKIIINGGVFGFENEEIDGVYAGGSGYMSPGLWTSQSAKPSQYGGNVYGKEGATVSSLTINGGTFYCKNGIFAGGRGTDQYYSYNAYGENGNNANFDALAQTYGNVELNITGGVFHCPVYGGGYGVADAALYSTETKKPDYSKISTLTKMARIYGQSSVNISGGTFYDNIYGGGDMAVIEYHGDGAATNLSISDDADIRGSVFAGGNGRLLGTIDENTKNVTQDPNNVGKVIGVTSANFHGSSDHAPYIYGDIYGGGNLAQVNGNTNVNIYAANFAGEIFGGGKGELYDDGSVRNSADITGNTYVRLAQDQDNDNDETMGDNTDNYSINVIWNKMWKEDDSFYVWDSYVRGNGDETLIADQTKFYDNGKYLNPHNIFGGGKFASKVDGTATVLVQKGMTPYSLLKTTEWKQSYTDNNNPHFYVFGGGYGKNTTVANTDVTVFVEGDYGIYDTEIDDNDDQLSKDNNNNLFDNDELSLSGSNKKSSSDGDSSPVVKKNRKASAKAASKADKTTIPVFDNSKGIPNFTVLGVMGGGYSGIVTGNTKVVVDGQTFIHRVYGGGFGDPESTINNETGQVKGNTEVHVRGAKTYGDIFGGGAGVAPKTANDIHFTDVARVLGTTMVEISDNANVYGKVFGGGDMANVGPADYTQPTNYKTDQPVSKSTLNQSTGTFVSYTADNYRSFVNIIGGDIYGEVFGGGKGLKKAKAALYNKVGRINGNTLVHIANTNTFSSQMQDNEGNDIPYIWNRIYGGCAYGTVDGNTLVHVEGGMLGLNIFGGGYGDIKLADDTDNDQSTGASTSMDILSQVLGKKDTNNEGTYANILGNTKVQIDGGSWIWNKRADVNGNTLTWTASDADNEKIMSGYEEFRRLSLAMNDPNSTDYEMLMKAKNIMDRIRNDKSTKNFFDLETYSFKKNHNIFGGGNRACYVGTYNGGTTNDLLSATPQEGTGDAVVEINHSPLTEIPDTKGNKINLLDCTTLQGFCWILANSNASHPQFSVFGAGYGANTKVGNAYVYAQPGTKLKDSSTEPQTIAGLTYRYLNQKDDLKRYLEEEDKLVEDFKKVSKEDKKIYYGSTTGGNADGLDDDPKTFQRYRTSRLAWHLGMPNFTFFEVHGGGFSGYVVGNTYVETDCQLNCRNIFGAGLGATPYGDVDVNKGSDYNFGSIGGASKVFIKAGNIAQNIYGGGAGVESARVSGKEIVDFNAKAGDILDFPYMARVNKSTQVHVYGRYMKNGTNVIDRTLVFGSVYGGGDVANVGTAEATDAKVFEQEDYKNLNNFTSLVNIRGGAIFSQAFAGGNGRKKSVCADYTKLGGIYGNSCFIVDRPGMTYPYCDLTTGVSYDPADDAYIKHPDDDVNPDIMPYVWNRAYGGCENGTIYGNTLVSINDGYLGHNVFGGGWGSCDTLSVNNNDEVVITSADVTGNANMFINGGEVKLTSYWLPEKRFWEGASIIGDKTYSPQYNPQTLKFKINHNIYAGGNTACVVAHNTYLTMVKGLLYDHTEVVSGQTNDKKFFERNEWKEVYEKIGSPHFCVFGGGFGENTTINGDTHVTVEMQKRQSLDITDLKKGEEYKHFYSGYSVMDIVGGGYSGKVLGDTHISGDGGVFCRRMFGGGFYNSVKATNVEVKAIDCQDIFGGGLMGDVLNTTNITIGYKQGEASTYGLTNKDIYIHGDVYGGNDVSGYVNVTLDKQGFFADNGGDGTKINIIGGHIYGDVYGAGNGDYLYALDKKGNTQVTVNEHYPLNPTDPNSETEPLVYTVPMRETMPSYKAASDAAKIVNINSWRPLTNKVAINIKGNSDTDISLIDGAVYGGGNSATVQKVQKQNSTSDETTGFIKLNIGSNTKIDRVFMGCNGDALFTTSEDNNFMNKFQKLNGDIEDYTKELNLADTIDWMGDPSNKGISTLYLSTKNSDRPTVYPHLLDLYFQPVETDIQGELKWNGSETGDGLANCTIGTFCCGGNRGNMNVYPAANGNAFEYTFPEGLTIIDKIVGGCNNANYNYKNKVQHEGGYLLGLAHSEYPFIKLNVNNKFNPSTDNDAYKGGNVYGGCYQSGTIRGDITIDLTSDMLEGKSKEMLEKSNELLGSKPEYSALNVYGAGYGMESYVYGNTDVKVAETVVCDAPSTTSTDDGYHNTFKASGTSANFIYGGGQQGNVIGVTNVEVFNGHVFKAVTGGSYSGYVWGSTQVKVGYPKYYQVGDKKSGIYLLNRTDQNNKYIDREDNSETGELLPNLASETIKQSIKLITGDLITQAVYDSIVGKEGVDKFVKSDYFIAHTSAPKSPLTWNDINIQIGEAVYGGGYSVAQGTSVLANNTTVLKFTDRYNLDNAFTTSDAHVAELKSLPNGTTEGFGGNTTILVADRVASSTTSSDGVASSTTSSSTDGDSSPVAPTDRDHITISHQEMKPIVLPEGTDLFGYYYKHEDGNYRYISLQDNYFYGKTYPDKQDPKDTKIYQYDSEGGIFGDGHQSYAEGFRSADLTGYGFAEHTVSNPKIINTFQRLDILRLEDNCFNVLGARDYATNATNKTPYSLSRIGEIQMFANNVDMKGKNEKGAYSVRSRNYLGLANNIHYVGAVTSNVPFDDAKKEPWRKGDSSLPTDGDFKGKSYQEVKQRYIDDYNKDNVKNEANFQKRNDGTAKNMIGIASGYALKIQNAQEFYNETSKKIEDEIYYGPIYGVVEMNLIDVRADEGGGYVYADNVHKRTAKEGETPHAVDFLETTGNFVFPYTAEEGRFIVDDCFPTGYYSLEGENPDTKVDVHYWYVTGFNYYYNAHITGYTYQSANKFYSDNADGLTVLSGLKAKQPVSIVSWKMRSGHPDSKDDYSCDLEYRNYQNTDDNVDMDGKKVFGGYALHIGASDSNTYKDPKSDDVADKDKGFAALLPMNSTDKLNYIRQNLPNEMTGDAKISFQLSDNVNNTTSDYYNKHLSEKCQATLVLKAPAYKTYTSTDDETKNERIISKVGTSEFFTYNEETKEYKPVAEGTTLDANTQYYIYNGIAEEYTCINDKKAYKKNTGGEYTEITDISKIVTGNSQIYYFEIPRFYTYTIYLTIEYVQGPNISGSITVENCALPGEMIRVKKNNVVISADESFSANGYYWRIGKREQDADGKWNFVDKTDWDITGSAAGYDTYKQGDKTPTKGLFAGCYYDKTTDDLDIPAYYFMNGYGIQLGITMNGLDRIFPVDINTDDKLVVHNYQRMDPHKTDIDLHIKKAIERAKEETDFACPRIYLSDNTDLAAFLEFISKDEDHGANAEFVVLNDLTIPDTYTGNTEAIFKGIVHGNGHVIKGLGADHTLIGENQGQIYNLGLASGSIAAKGCTNGGAYHCCYEYTPAKSASKAINASNGKASSSDGVSTPVVYRMNGTADTHYTTEDFRLGRVAYDLNEYYLRARYSLTSDEDKAAQKYLYDYYANGDYQYARRSDAITGNNTGYVYLRTGKDSDLPNYEQTETRHDRTHSIDKARVVKTSSNGSNASSSNDVSSIVSSFDGVSTPVALSSAIYEPLFDDNHEDASEPMNDFLYWGQSLQSSPEPYPTELVSQQNKYMTNRVYRTAGYYGDTMLDAFHYNAYNYGGSSMDTYVHDTNTTAIDFTCQNDLPKAMDMTTASPTAHAVYYPPVDDNATIFHDLSIKNGVSQNLLVYTDANNADEENDTEAYDIASKTLTYGEKTQESLIKGHHIYKDGDNDGGTPEFTTALLHLVERTPDSMDSEGATCDNNDFCAPIPLSVTNRAWYTRKPQYYANDNTGAWEGICLPFTVDKVEASVNGELTHFYGTPTEEEVADPKTNIHTLHHEYWLRGLISVNTESGKTSAVYQRPGAAGTTDKNGTPLFAPTDADGTSLCEAVSYGFDTPFFIDNYEDRLYNKDANPYYAEAHTYNGYQLQAANVPYIVRFPGERYYEFDLSSSFYNNITGKKAAEQTVTFNAYGPNSSTANYGDGSVVIPVSSAGSMATTATGNYSHHGIYTATKVAQGNIYGMNDNGTAFDDASALSTVMPFRTYMSVATGGKARSAAPSVINIAEPTGIDKIEPEINGNDDDADETDFLKVYPIGKHRVLIESTQALKLEVYTVAGQLFRTLDVQPGTATYSGFPSGMYLFGKTKIAVE